jgi:glycosyltransferase involved in cell wall biosynthesis
MLVMWGAGPLEAQVKDSLAHGDVGELEPLSLSDVPEGLAACDVLVVPSRTTPSWREQFGRVLVEAMLAGVPIVAYNSGAIAEVVGTAGKLVPEGDVDGLAQAIREVLVDPAVANRLAAEGRERAREQFYPDRVAERLVHLWTRICAEGR